MRVLEALGKQTKTRTVPPDDRDPVGSFRPENIEITVERIGASVPNQRNQSFRTFTIMWSAT
jgi:hypothetical protein